MVKRQLGDPRGQKESGVGADSLPVYLVMAGNVARDIQRKTDCVLGRSATHTNGHGNTFGSSLGTVLRRQATYVARTERMDSRYK